MVASQELLEPVAIPRRYRGSSTHAGDAWRRFEGTPVTQHRAAWRRHPFATRDDLCPIIRGVLVGLGRALPRVTRTAVRARLAVVPRQVVDGVRRR